MSVLVRGYIYCVWIALAQLISGERYRPKALSVFEAFPAAVVIDELSSWKNERF